MECLAALLVLAADTRQLLGVPQLVAVADAALHAPLAGLAGGAHLSHVLTGDTSLHTQTQLDADDGPRARGVGQSER